MYSMELGGLAKYSKYSITVLAYNAVGPGPNSLPEVLVTTLEDGKYININKPHVSVLHL
jgi:hypothetical protein